MENDNAYREKFDAAKRLATKLLKDNEVNPKTKLAYKLIYAVFYGVFNGELPPGVTILLLAGRADDLIEKQS